MSCNGSAVDPVFQVDIWVYTPFALAMMVILPICSDSPASIPIARRSLIEETYTIYGRHRGRGGADYGGPLFQPAALQPP